MVDMPNTMNAYLITTSRDEMISLMAPSEWLARQLFAKHFPRKRISTVTEWPSDIPCTVPSIE
jgi:hypothetical protein